ncbi:triphosphoribosyl-dephospho-CoA synthase [Mesorhizobium sp. ASY16-5R]|uniref:triphosphoribosyl-dephospho-CoA synthase n=1 Tax=Mesorhizobium sp. ASY16-5R TaxID=3445772 RepID=UPI003FA06F8D
MLSRDVLPGAYEDACRLEIEALKPGNVHVFADGHRMSAAQFLESARVSSPPLTDPALPVGRRMLEAVRATRQAVGTNTNLGIILLCAPLIRAAEMDGTIACEITPNPSPQGGGGPGYPFDNRQSSTNLHGSATPKSPSPLWGGVRGGGAPRGTAFWSTTSDSSPEIRNLRENLRAVLDAIDLDDTGAVFEAIVAASPGGLGSTDGSDVREAPKVTLVEAMREAAGRDLIARQYANGFDDIFELGVPALQASLERGETGMWPTIAVYMAFLTSFPDSHVTRKHGSEIAQKVLEEAQAVRAALDAATDEVERVTLLSDFDRDLKVRGINPGTSADLTVACLLVHILLHQLAQSGG